MPKHTNEEMEVLFDQWLKECLVTVEGTEEYYVLKEALYLEYFNYVDSHIHDFSMALPIAKWTYEMRIVGHNPVHRQQLLFYMNIDVKEEFNND